MTTVIDASTVVAALVDSGPDGTWAEAVLAGGALAAPHLLPAEVSNILRRAANAGHITPDAAALAHANLLALRVDLYDYEPLAVRIWALGHNVSSYDAWYVALAESLDAPLATLDGALTRAPGPRCSFMHPN